MSQQGRFPETARPPGDAWTAFSYLVGGTACYGGLGWLLDRWLGTGFFVPIGVLGGMALGLCLVYARFWHAATGSGADPGGADAGADRTRTADSRDAEGGAP